MYFNIERARKLMDKFGVDALIASTPENITYLTDTVSWAPKVYSYSVDMFAIYIRDERVEPAMIVPSQEMTYVSWQESWVKDYYTYGGKSALIQRRDHINDINEIQENVYLSMQNNDLKRSKGSGEALVKAIKDKGLSNSRIALDEDKITNNVMKQITEALPNASFINSSVLFKLIRTVKTKDEIDAMRSAATLNEKACNVACESIKVDMTEIDISRIFAEEVSKGLGKWLWFHFGSGRRSIGIFPPTNKKITKGEMWKFDAGISLNNYQADTGWGGIIGEPNKDQLNIWHATLAGFNAALSIIKSGILPSEIQNAMLNGTKDNGLPEHCGTFAGHAIGLEMRELPYVLGNKSPIDDVYLPDNTDIPLEEGTVLCIENPCQVLGLGGTQIEKTIIVTKNGYEPLVKQERKLWIVDS